MTRAFAPAGPRQGRAARSRLRSPRAEGHPNAEAATRAELLELNRSYEAKHGFIFIVCASGRSAGEMLGELRARHGRERGDELRTAGEEQAKITRLRLAKLLEEL